MKFRNTQINPVLAILGLPIIAIVFLIIGITEAIKKLEPPFEYVYGVLTIIIAICFSEAIKLLDKE